MLEYIVWAAVCATTLGQPAGNLTDFDPCSKATCGVDEQCVSKIVTDCAAPPCYPTYKCLGRTRPGKCPAVTPEVHPEFAMCIDHCAEDVECPNRQKCCPSSCGGHVCVNPSEKPGQCPSLETSYIGLCAAQCTSDMDCAGTKKCCGGCPRECTEPVNATQICHNIHCPPGYACHLAPVLCKVAPCYPIASCLLTKKPGPHICPTRPVPISDTCIDECSVDGQCPADDICCKIGCHQVCSEPLFVPPKKGECPKMAGNGSLLDGPGHTCHHECIDDHDCAASEKCCGDCGKCVAPVSVNKPGKCPEDPLSVFPILGLSLRCHGRSHCTSDADCSGEKKCCGSCPKKCLAPVAASAKKTSKCPAIVHVVNCVRAQSRVKKCTVDSDCRKGSICCSSVTCGKVCVRELRMRSPWWLG